jgi:RimJ/RimL family protein N-acetyltransferase
MTPLTPTDASPPLEIRLLQAGERDAVERFFLTEMDDVSLYWRFFRTMTPATVHAHIEQMAFSGQSAVFGACIGERVVGVAELASIPGSEMCQENRPGSPAACAELGIAVSDRERRRGIARELMEGLLRHAWMRGLKRVQLSSLKDNRPMLLLAEKTGFRVLREQSGEIIMQATRPADWPLQVAFQPREEEALAAGTASADEPARDARAIACPMQMIQGRCEP